MESIDQFQPYIRDISFCTYCRRQKEAIAALSAVLWGYTAQDNLEVLELFFPTEGSGG